MPRPGAADPSSVAAIQREWVVRGVYNGAGTSNMVKVQAPGIASVVRTGVGVHTVTFLDVGRLAGLEGTVNTVSTNSPLLVKYVPASFNIPAKTLQIEVWSLAGALIDLPPTSVWAFGFHFFDTP